MRQKSSKNAWHWEVQHYILLGGGKVTQIFCMAQKELICKLEFDVTIDHHITCLAKCSVLQFSLQMF